ncbi:hypothetical protein LX36DRAFT_673545 [Colletotrichum falcatum]|nr:hypothetical protein LX36DRAFT_673545 [Colletotrichum falcatum]
MRELPLFWQEGTRAGLDDGSSLTASRMPPYKDSDADGAAQRGVACNDSRNGEKDFRTRDSRLFRLAMRSILQPALLPAQPGQLAARPALGVVSLCTSGVPHPASPFHHRRAAARALKAVPPRLHLCVAKVGAT